MKISWGYGLDPLDHSPIPYQAPERWWWRFSWGVEQRPGWREQFLLPNMSENIPPSFTEPQSLAPRMESPMAAWAASNVSWSAAGMRIFRARVEGKATASPSTGLQYPPVSSWKIHHLVRWFCETSICREFPLLCLITGGINNIQ